jgi:heptosyltransferase II
MKPGPATPLVHLTRTPRRVLVRGVNWLGDAVMTAPALLRLREALPGAQIGLLTHEKLAGLWLNHPAIDQLLTFRQGESIWSVKRRLRAQAFDTALVLPNSVRSALEVWLAGVPQRFGSAGGWRDCLLTQAVPPAPGLTRMRKRTASEIRSRLASGLQPEGYPTECHQLFHYLHLTAALGASAEPLVPALNLTAAEKDAVATQLFTRAGGRPDPTAFWFGLNPGAEYGPAKRWPVEQFIRAANAISQRTGCRWMLFGAAREQRLADEILQAVPTAASLCGQTTLRELMVGLGHCRLLLTNDTGPMHLAAAVGTPVVALFGSTSPELTGPGLPGDARHAILRAAVPCSPCFLRQCPVDFRCMKNLPAEAVVAAVLRCWERSGGSAQQPV